MLIYNTKTRKKEIFKPISSREVKVYFCGPTPYNFAHIWNLKTYVFEDVVVKTLRFLWYNLKTTMNITDIDDKTIRDSQKMLESLSSFTKKYSKAFLEDIEKLWIKKADNVVFISSLIPEMVRMIQTMLNRKNAYFWDDWSIYFDVCSFKNYWKLANLDISWLKKSVRIDNDEYGKEEASDFALWKAWKKEDGDNFWEAEFFLPDESEKPNLQSIQTLPSTQWTSPHPQPLSGQTSPLNLSEQTSPLTPLLRGEGDRKVVIKWRPGWHIECSACNMKYFWAQIDIHMWGIDNLFPHHQNEVAQTESCTKKEFSRYWIHWWHLSVDGKKMSKSLWNFYTLKDLEDKFKDVDRSVLYRAIRLSFMNWKYRDSIDFSFDKLNQMLNTIVGLDNTLKNVFYYKSSLWDENSKSSISFRNSMQDFIISYTNELEDDFNIPNALSVFYSFEKFVNTWIRKNDFSFPEVSSILDMFKTFNEVLSIMDFDILDLNNFIPSDISSKLEKRNDAKRKKDFVLADSLRNDIESQGYRVIDDRNWSRVEKF